MEDAAVDGAKAIFKFICSGFKTLLNYEDIVSELRDEIANLTNKKVAIREEVILAIEEDKVPMPQVNEWLKKVSQAEDDVRRLLEMADEYAQGRVSKMTQCWTMAKKLDLVKELNNTHFETVASERGSPIKPMVKMSVPPLVGKGVASDTKKLLELLSRKDIKRIGVWGKGGVGKTALVMTLNNELSFSSPNFFEIVIWVQISTSMDLRTIQSQIANRIHLKVEAGDTTHIIASRIFQRLKPRTILLILDDVWEKIDLDAVGIPSWEPSCKILLTTRSRDVCREMSADVSFPKNLMSEEDAWELFVHSAGPVVESNGIEPLAREIVAGFNGLPLVIKSFGNSMRDRPQIEFWRNASVRRQSSSPLFENIEKDIFGTLAKSYYSLPNENLKQFFLFCSLYPARFSIDVCELVQCWVCDGLIEENLSVQEAYDEGVTSVEQLMDSCLLDKDLKETTVKMLDFYRDLAIHLSRNHELLYGFHTQPGLSFRQMPIESSKRVSLMHCSIKKLPEFPVYSQLTVLFLQGNPIQKIPNDFFRSLVSLRVLNLSETQMTCLPPSFVLLCELRCLFLRNCFIEKLPSLNSLSKLLVLDLSSTRIKTLPKGFGSLHSLRELNLSHTPFLNKIVAGSVSGLSSLETLDMSFSSYNWNPKTGSDKKETFDELLSLEKLSVLQIRLDSVNSLESASFWLNKLKRFDIQISPWSHGSNHHVAKHSNERRLVLRGVDLLQEDLKDLLHNTSSLDMSACGGMKKRHWLSLSSLISLNLSHCDVVTHLISNVTSSQEMFPNLQHLVLEHLQNLNTIAEGIIKSGKCLRNLKTIQVVDCPLLKGVVSYAMLHHVKKLEEIKVSGCENMSCIVESGEHEETLPNLRVLEISNMVSLSLICGGTSVCPVLQQIKVFHCFGLKTLPISIANSCSLKKIEGDIKWWNSLSWEDDENKDFFQQHFQAYHNQNCPKRRKYK